ncbi:hypothetical protein CG51_12985 [Haematobacter missouriensis]|uniref:Aldehyde-activating protein n=1 Tax=Haematobacter missouriensis TaxID=366616 RepID=A0A212ATT6_9RHOB|nr:GFA family protein [Haematobacter missouriensis]KFI33215.1 hypothetical protein CG51_12985 [Haematobacter missouriensis]OWJ75722.1 aldehyde-activating protein [Haematobacter missouriensis]OWJ84911.1 aldehyde-activating protein [Haematobacter missouriensis]
MERNDERLEGACHCGKVRFSVRLAGGLNAARRCDCSICAMRGAVTLSTRLADFTLLGGAEVLRTYRFNTGVAEHHFCGNCGIYTHHKRRSNPDQFGVNAACLGISPFDFAEVQVNDGVHHPADGSESRVVGVLRFERL